MKIIASVYCIHEPNTFCSPGVIRMLEIDSLDQIVFVDLLDDNDFAYTSQLRVYANDGVLYSVADIFELTNNQLKQINHEYRTGSEYNDRYNK